MSSIQDWIWAVAWEACLIKLGTTNDSPFWVENDLPSKQTQPSGDLKQNLEYDLEEQIENFVSTDGTPIESITTPFDHSPVVQEGHNVSGHGQKEASGGPNAEGVAEGNTVNPTEQIAPHVTQDLTLEQ